MDGWHRAEDDVRTTPWTPGTRRWRPPRSTEHCGERVWLTPPVTWNVVAEDSSPQITGPNAWLVDEMYEQYLADPSSVSESWHDFFQGYRPTAVPRGGTAAGTTAPPAAPVAPTPAAPSPAAAPAAAVTPQPGTPLRGAAARIVLNMEA